MKYIVETSLEDFNAWSGGYRNLKELKKHPAAFNHISDMLDQVTDNWSDTEINDFLWFDMYDELRIYGYVDEDDNWLDKDAD